MKKKIKKTIIFDEKDKIDTLGGLVFSLAERIPERGEIIKYEQQNMEFNVVEADTRKIKKIVIHFK